MKALAADDPRVIGEYRLHAQLGQGGMGRVYLGLSPAGRAVAVKVVHPELARDEEFLRRFRQEVASARAVSGMYTAAVVAAGLDQSPPWLATAFVPGPPLDQMVTRHGPLPEPALWPLLAGLVEALQAIHVCGVVDRDLKPANVLLAADGPRVIDFGIARATDGTAVTATGIVFGTPGYMSPEQAEAKPAGPASDVFALGGVAAYAATGCEPFGTGTAASVLYRVVYAEPDLNGVPPRLRELIGACLAKDPAGRPALPTLAAAIASGTHDTGPSALSFWPRSVASLIGAYQASLDTQLSAGAGTIGTDSSIGLVPAVTEHPPTALTPPAAGVATSPAAAQAAAPAAAGVAAAAPGQMTYPVSQGYPATQGYLSPQGYPSPQGYGGPQGNAGLQPRGGYLPGGAGYPQPIPAAWHPPAQRPALPASIRRAVRFMYAAAIIALLNGFRALADTSTYGGYVPQRLFGQVHVVTRSTALTEVTIGFVIQVALWIALARACKDGKNWARITGTVFFGILTIGLLTGIRSSASGPGLVLAVLGWLAGLGAAVLLWRRPSSAFFTAAKGGR